MASPTHGIRIVESVQDEKDFLNFPYLLYGDDENWVAPLRLMQKDILSRKKNPFYKNADMALFLAELDGKPAGRIAAIKNRAYIEHTGENAGFFGFFECVDNQNTANLLFKVASDWLYGKGVSEIYGPMSPNMMGEIGVLVEGFELSPMFLMPYNKPYFDNLITGAGFHKHVDLLAYGLTKDATELVRAEKAETLVLKRYPTLTVRKVNLKKWKQEVAVIGDIFNKAWSKNWGFAPFTHKEFEYLVGDMRYIIEQDLALVVEDNGKPVAFSVGLPDINIILKEIGNGKLLPMGWYKLLTGIKKLRIMRLLLMGIIPEYQGKGIDALMNLHSIRNGLALGYEEAEFSWLLENNTSVINLAERFGAKLTKRYRVYKK